ncbi:hypothetical protein Mycsm_03267 [Mycobacterium sp. JS623]|uniref:substrate-binding domain-containing protein n=1 Tax=Mycobacterium sp. JS623 TaxID=212767 RepID=UPI0002A563BD|nr:substrate-binding domain-containing protein [Mycobacterium sp. JS623]AGB23574.1 hypothetical protein Mycsm_03267 [Mycobacterium sp. JS623]
MGRHSAPDPEDSADEGVPEEPPTQRFGRQPPPEPDGPGAGYDEPAAYPSTPYPDGDFDEPSYDDAGYDSGYDGPGYDEPDYGGDYGQADFDEPADEYPHPEPARGAGPPPRSGQKHSGEWEGGEWTGSHRAITPGRRGVSVGVIAALVAVVVIVGAFILWRFFGDALSHRSDALAARCVDGDLAVSVVADPSIADQVHKLADAYNKSAAPVADKCVKIGVRPADSDQVVNGFIGKWPPELGERPALWIPASSVSEARLEAAAGAQTVSDSRSLVTSPVLIATRPQLKNALAQQNWGTLPGLQTNQTALDGLNLPGWGPLRLSLPLSGDSDASYLAAEAVAAASAPAGQPASAGAGAVNTLVGGQPRLADNKWTTAMDALVNSSDPATAPVHAVVSTEQQLFARAASMPNAKDRLASWLPPGPTAIADYPTVLLSGNWLSQEQVSAASEFARFMRKPEQLAELAKAGFRTEGATPPKSDVTSFAPVSAPLSIGDASMRATLANALTAPAESPAVTIVLDQSMPTDEGGKSRLANVVAALNARLRALPQNAAVGLWTFDGVEGRSEVSTGPLSDQVNGQPRSAALTSALNSQTASGGGAVSFTTLRMLYDQAKANYRQGQNNSILLITAGPHTDQSLDGSGLQQYIRGAFDQGRPIAVNVIDFGNDSDRSTWEAVAQASGGSYQNLGSSASPDLTAAITQFVG